MQDPENDSQDIECSELESGCLTGFDQDPTKPEILQTTENIVQEIERSETKWGEITMPVLGSLSGSGHVGLFRTPISGGVQSATSSHGLPHPALAVRNLMEQVKC